MKTSARLSEIFAVAAGVAVVGDLYLAPAGCWCVLHFLRPYFFLREEMKLN